MTNQIINSKNSSLIEEGRLKLKIAIVGDIHEQWDEGDSEALKQLGMDLVLFVGDFGNESVEVVRKIASLDIPKAAIMGNHDAWYSATEWGRKKCPYDRAKEDRVQQQLDLLAEAHIGYSKLDLPNYNLTVVGSRPFSWGGPKWKFADICQTRYGIETLEDSTDLIMQSVKSAAHNTIIFLGHNGPFGLGDKPEDPCGKDWHPIGGDYGDSDLAEAISQTLTRGKRVPLVTFGHMHHTLRHTKKELRKRVFTSPEGIVYLNAACVPRIVANHNQKLRNFSIVLMEDGTVTQVSLIWVGKDFEIDSEEILYQNSSDTVQNW